MNTSASQIQRHINTEEKASKKVAQKAGKMAVEQKSELIEACLGQSKRNAKKILLSKQSEAASGLSQEKIKPLSSVRSEIRFSADEVFFTTLANVKNLIGNQSLEIIFGQALEALLAKEEKKRGIGSKTIPANKTISEDPLAASEKSTKITWPAKSVALPKTGSNNPNSRFIPIEFKRMIYERSQGQCEFVDSKSKRRCHSKYLLQIDHIQPYSLGGQTVIENLRHLCGTHNRLSAKRWGLSNKSAATARFANVPERSV